MAMLPDYSSLSLDYAAHRDFETLLHQERMTQVISNGRSRRMLRNLGLAFLLATGTFWGVMLQAPPTTIAADPGTQAKAFSPLDLMIPTELPVGNYDAN